MSNPNTHLVQALDADASGQWDRAHELVQDDPSREAAWVHAYLHRREGDAGNARYWYARAGQPWPGNETLDAERSRLRAHFAGA